MIDSFETNEILIGLLRIHGIKAIPGKMSIMNEPNTKQHFANIRIDWNIQI